MRRDWPGWMLVTLGTLGPELVTVGRLRVTPGTEGSETLTSEGPGAGAAFTPALVTRSGEKRVLRDEDFRQRDLLGVVTALAVSLASELVSS